MSVNILTVDVVEGQEGQNPVTFAISTSIPSQVTFTSAQLEDIGNDISMREHDPLRDTSGARGENKESNVLGRIHLRPTKPSHAGNIPDRGKMLDLDFRITLVADQKDPTLRYPSLARRFLSHWKNRNMSSQCLGAGGLQLELQLLDRVCGVGGRNNTSSPVRSPCYNGRIDAIGSEQCQHVALLPFVDGPQALSEVKRGIL